TFWNKKTTDALVNITLAPSSAASQLSPLLNVESTQGWGHELQTNIQLLDRRNLGWDMTVSASHFSNKVVSLGSVSGLCQTSPNDPSITPVIFAFLLERSCTTTRETRTHT